uniref:Uncharacterized protein n=1 Tax=Arundo donax TaxID=35708 RepID=A0A0A9AV07_ARUDO
MENCVQHYNRNGNETLVLFITKLCYSSQLKKKRIKARTSMLTN